MRIGELARRTGVSRRALRYYEQQELLHARRGANGWREYDEAAVARVRRIAELLADGLTVDGVRRLAPCLQQHGAAECADPGLPARTYRERLTVLDGRMARLQERRDRLAARIDAARD